MTKKLEELLNLPESKDLVDQDKKKSKAETAIVEQEETLRAVSYTHLTLPTILLV